MGILSWANEILTDGVTPNDTLASDQSCQKCHLIVMCVCVRINSCLSVCLHSFYSVRHHLRGATFWGSRSLAGKLKPLPNDLNYQS